MVAISGRACFIRAAAHRHCGFGLDLAVVSLGESTVLGCCHTRFLTVLFVITRVCSSIRIHSTFVHTHATLTENVGISEKLVDLRGNKRETPRPNRGPGVVAAEVDPCRPGWVVTGGGLEGGWLA